MADTRIRPSDEVVQENIRKWNIPQPDREYTVLIHCTTYNHGKYIKDALDGFVNQQCSFSFCAIIIDDCSTDNAPEIIKEYAEKYPDIIKPILLGENHMQRGILRNPYFEKWHQSAKYLAQCEGDDYWTDPLKLQKQVDYMESHPECVMCCSNGYCYSEKFHTKEIIDPIPVTESRVLTTNEVFLEENALIPTCSMCYRKEMQDSMPEFFRKVPVSDRSIRMWCAINGDIYYHKEPLITYRSAAIGCYTSRVKQNKVYAKRIYEEMFLFFDKFDEYTNFAYHADVEYMKNREAYVYYCNIADFRHIITSKHLMTYSFAKRTKIRLKNIIKLIPGIYPIYQALKK